MFARMTTVYLPDANTSAEILRVHEQLYSNLRGLKGFRDYIALVNRTTGEAKALVLWDTREDMHANRDETALMGSRIFAQLNTTPQAVEEYEVAFHT